jgi:hypothetical protein
LHDHHGLHPQRISLGDEFPCAKHLTKDIRDDIRVSFPQVRSSNEKAGPDPPTPPPGISPA